MNNEKECLCCGYVGLPYINNADDAICPSCISTDMVDVLELVYSDSDTKTYQVNGNV